MFGNTWCCTRMNICPSSARRAPAQAKPAWMAQVLANPLAYVQDHAVHPLCDPARPTLVYAQAVLHQHAACGVLCLEFDLHDEAQALFTSLLNEGSGANEKWARLDPYHGFKLSFEIDFNHPAVDSTGQRVEFDLSTGSYSRDIARARTFGFTKDVEMMRANGLALGGGLDNAIVMDDYKVLNSDGLRYDDEFVKHKILDAMGDLFLIGKPLLASYVAFRSGHAMNNKLLRELLSQPDAYDVVTFDDARKAPPGLAQLAPAW